MAVRPPIFVEIHGRFVPHFCSYSVLAHHRRHGVDRDDWSEVIGFSVICIRTKKSDLIFGITSLIVDRKHEKVSGWIFVYRTSSNLILMTLITIWLTVDFECRRCTDYAMRAEYERDASILTILVYSWLSVVAVPIISILLAVTFGIFTQKASKSRELKDMIAAGNYDSILEMQLYNSKFGVYDEENGITLLMLAFQEERGPIISYLLMLDFQEEWSRKDAKERCILDYYMMNRSSDEEINSSMTKSLLKVDQKLNLKDRDGRDAFLCGCAKGLGEVDGQRAWQAADQHAHILSSAPLTNHVIKIVTRQRSLTGQPLQLTVHRHAPDQI